MSLSDSPVVILGTFRSGTSAIATAYSAMGVHFGDEKDFQPADEFNLGGYWEVRDMQSLNAKILASFGTSYYQVDRIPDDWQSFPGVNAIVSEIRSLLRGKFSSQKHWGWKEPATSVLLPLYKEALSAEGIQHPIYAIAVRHPLSVAASQTKRQSPYSQDVSAEDSLHVEERTVGLWMNYTLASLKEAIGSARQIINYERFLQTPKTYLEWSAQHMADPRPSSGQISDGAATIKPEWSHSNYGHEDLKPYSEIVTNTYDVCLRADKDPDGFSSGSFDKEIDQLWNEWMTWSKMVRPIFLPAGQMIFRWQEATGQQNGHAEKFSPTSQWQSVNVVLNAQPGSEIHIDPYQMPSQIWIRKAVWRVGQSERKAMLVAGQNGILEDVFGVKKLTLFGPGSLVGQIPPGQGDVEFEMEFRIQSGQVVLSEIISQLRGRLDQARRGAPSGAGPVRR